MIKRILCALSLHRLNTIAMIETVDIVECEHCKRKWAVETERHQVYELRKERA